MFGKACLVCILQVVFLVCTPISLLKWFKWVLIFYCMIFVNQRCPTHSPYVANVHLNVGYIGLNIRKNKGYFHFIHTRKHQNSNVIAHDVKLVNKDALL